MTRLPPSVCAVLAAACLAGGTSCSQAPPGRVMVVVTTDMAVPADIDTLYWKATLPGDDEPFRHDSVLLEQVGQPATLALVAGPKTRGAVVIELEGLLVGMAGRSRVQRFAELELPDEGVRELAMPLNWLCSEANLPVPCAQGKTCRAGQCEDRRIEAPRDLPSYDDRSELACFDAVECFRSFTRMVPETRSYVLDGQCATPTRVAAAPEINVALIVDNAAVGNYGICQNWDQEVPCLVPLDRNGPEGWHTEEAYDGVHLVLPDAVCEQLGKSIQGIAIAPLANNGGCRAKVAGQPPCTAEDTCLEASICPPEWSETGAVGYSCSAAQVPNVPDCLPLGAELEQEPVPGHWCCGDGQSGAISSDPLVIDDMTGAPVMKQRPPEGAEVGGWWTDTDDPEVRIHPQPHTLFTYRAIDPPVTVTDDQGRDLTITRAACLRSSGFRSFYAAMGLAFAYRNGEPVPIDASEYTGLSYWVRTALDTPTQQRISVQIQDANTHGYYSEATCHQQPELGACSDFFASREVLLNADWEQKFMRWDELEQSPDQWGAQFDELDTTGLTGMQFHVQGKGTELDSPPFDFCVAYLYFTTE